MTAFRLLIVAGFALSAPLLIGAGVAGITYRAAKRILEAV